MTSRLPGTEVSPPSPISFRTETYVAGTRFPRSGAPWGELNYALSGVFEFTIGERNYLSPPSYAIWIPPGIEHEAWNRQTGRYSTIYIDRGLCGCLPDKPLTLILSPLTRAIVADFAGRGLTSPRSEADRRLASVLVDQISLSPRFDQYLPVADDPLLLPIIDALQADPGLRRSLGEWAYRAGVSEKTLSRRWTLVLGIGFNQWRLRLKLVRSFSMLDSGEKVQDVATALGYGDASAFIAMFRKLTGSSPTQVVKSHREAEQATLS